MTGLFLEDFILRKFAGGLKFHEENWDFSFVQWK
jgi:hypothetical protein